MERKKMIVSFIFLFFIIACVTFFNNISAQSIKVVFTDNYSDFTEDVNGDGLADYLIVNVEIDAKVQGNHYFVVGDIFDKNGNMVDRVEERTDSSIGIQRVQLRFNGSHIFMNGIDGPFILTNLYIQDRNPFPWEMSEERNNIYNTSFYKFTDFQPSDLFFTGTFSDEGVDVDADGLFDYLRISVGINSSKTGNHSIHGTLYNKGEEISSTENSTYLTPGLHMIQLNFDGSSISNSMSSGIFTLDRLFIDDEEGETVGWTSATYNTSSYTYADFKLSPLSFIPSEFLNSGEDFDDNGLFDDLAIETALNIDKAGNYEIFGYLRDPNNQEFPYVATLADKFETGVNKIKLNFDGGMIRQNGVNGSYSVKLELYSEEGNYLLKYIYASLPYNATDFEYPSVSLIEVTGDHGTDINEDGKFDYLTLDLKLNVIKNGEYTIMGYLLDKEGNFIVFARKNVSIDAGEQIVALNFNCEHIYQSSVNGTLTLTNIEINNDLGKTVSSEEVGYVTSSYSSAQFAEEAFTPKYLSIDFWSTLIIFIVVVILVIAILLFKLVRKPKD